MSRSKRGGRSKGSKFFTTTKKGEIRELQVELQSVKKDQQKEAVKKVIAAMTVGKDVSMLFTDVLNCMQTDDIELKKLVYLYLMNYAKSNPDLAILAVNSFKRDTRDHNALIRALAVRTMGCIRVDKISEYLCDPLRRTLKDEDPYVRKTAAVCVAKLYDISPDLVVQQDFIGMLQNLISDSNPMVVANAIAALSEIQEAHGEDVLRVDTRVLQKLLAALNECTEWGQVFILDSLALYEPRDAREAENIIDRVVPRLKHANSAVVLSAVKVIIKYMSSLNDPESEANLVKKMSPPLVSLMSHAHGEFPEIQYVALRNINLIVQKIPHMLNREIKVFFCKYDDPIYVKMEKLEIIIKLSTERNIDQVLMELKEYSREVDVDFVRKSVRAIGRCAIKLERAAERCINSLLELIQTKVNYVVQEAIIVIKDIFRKYPNRYESIIATLCENLVSLDEPEAKAAMIWIIGEYAERIDNADELLEHFMESFHDEQSQVQLQLLTAVVKLFLKKPNETKDMVQSILTLATEKSDNPDLRDRGYVYWRLLSSDPKAAKMVVLADKPVIADDTCELQPALLETLLSNISTLAAIYHKPPEAFVQRRQGARLDMDDDDDSDDDDDDDSDDDDDDSDDNDAGGVNERKDNSAAVAEPAVAEPGLIDLGFGDDNSGESGGGGGGGSFMDDLFGAGSAAPPAASLPSVSLNWQGGGSGPFEMSAGLVRNGDDVQLKMQVNNTSGANVSQMKLQCNKNVFGLKPSNKGAITLDSSGAASVPMSSFDNNVKAAFDKKGLQAALKITTTGDVAFFFIPFSFSALTTAEGDFLTANGQKAGKQKFLKHWKSIDASNEAVVQIPNLKSTDLESVKSSLLALGIHFITDRAVHGQPVAYFSSQLLQGLIVLFELRFSGNMCTMTSKSNNSAVMPSAHGEIQKALSA